MNKVIIILVMLFIAVSAIIFYTVSAMPSVVTSFDECVAAGYPVMESYPRQCMTEDKQVFVEPMSPQNGSRPIPPEEIPVPPQKRDTHPDIPDTDGDENSVFCTMDAKVCPDGTYVGRIPPDCEFAPCPGQ